MKLIKDPKFDALFEDLTKKLFFNREQSTTKEEIKQLAIQLLNSTWTIDINSFTRKEFNLIDLGWHFEFNTRKTALGLCSGRKKTIYVSTWYLEQHLDKAWRFENTIRHEIAHAIDFEIRGFSDHSYKWKNIATQVLSIAERCVPIGGEPTEKKTTKYTLICDNCGKETPRHKKATRVKHACGVCCDAYNGGRYTDKYRLRQVQNY
jgi:predicted SprT family Zn-dependent metalloprotease